MSYIGREPIQVPPDVTVTKLPSGLKVEGPLGSATLPVFPFVSLSHSEEENKKLVAVSVEDDRVKQQRQMWGTTRTLLANSIVGLTQGFNVCVHLVGVGYRAAIEPDPRPTEDTTGERLNMKLGYSHSVCMPIPKEIKASITIPTRIELFSTDKQKMGQFAANIRSKRKPEPYKGKVIRSYYYSFSHILIILSRVYLLGRRLSS
jgi:large subunit ribosomal protein L6